MTMTSILVPFLSSIVFHEVGIFLALWKRVHVLSGFFVSHIHVDKSGFEELWTMWEIREQELRWQQKERAPGSLRRLGQPIDRYYSILAYIPCLNFVQTWRIDARSSGTCPEETRFRKLVRFVTLYRQPIRLPYKASQKFVAGSILVEHTLSFVGVRWENPHWNKRRSEEVQPRKKIEKWWVDC